MQEELKSSEQQALILKKQLTDQKDELNQTRAKLDAAKADAVNQWGARKEMQRKLDMANRQLNMTRSELAADSGELNMTRREMESTLSAVKDLHEMRTRLAAVGDELKGYQSALTARTSELNATRTELQAAKNLRKADARAAMSEVKMPSLSICELH
jgi:chromosome segregation ATPase